MRSAAGWEGAEGCPAEADDPPAACSGCEGCSGLLCAGCSLTESFAPSAFSSTFDLSAAGALAALAAALSTRSRPASPARVESPFDTASEILSITSSMSAWVTWSAGTSSRPVDDFSPPASALAAFEGALYSEPSAFTGEIHSTS